MLQQDFIITRRMRRNRKSEAMRALVQETRLHPSNFVPQFFVTEGTNQKNSISSMPNIFRFSIDTLLKEIEVHLELGIRSCNIFCYTPEDKKDARGSEAIRQGNLLQQSVSAIKREFPELVLMADIALDPFTDHGHDGLVDGDGNVLNDPSVYVLQEMSLRAAEAGCDIVAPSDMMDGRIGLIRKVLDEQGFESVGILAYAAKYASSFYGPFRDALGSAPKFGDKKTYQLNPANSREAILESLLDEEEGADMLLIKPAIFNLDIIAKLRDVTCLPIGAFQISGEYAMIKAGVEKGWLHESNAIIESLLSIKRAGADFIFTYAAKEAAQILLERFPY
jgi:porphobilinogen synthase